MMPHRHKVVIAGNHGKAVDISFLDADARTPIGRRFRVKDQECLVRTVAKMGDDAERTRHALACWGQGSICVDLSPELCRFFGILHP